MATSSSSSLLSARAPASSSSANSAKRRSKFDVSLTLAAEQDTIAAVYHKYFRNEAKCKVIKSRFLDTSGTGMTAPSTPTSSSAPPSPSSSSLGVALDANGPTATMTAAAAAAAWHGGCDTLVLPLTSSFGLVGTASPLLSAIVKAHLDDGFEQRLQDVIARKYLGELPLGVALVLRNERALSPLRFVVVTALARVLTVRGDSMAWLDPAALHVDFAYTALRGALLAVVKHNASVRAGGSAHAMRHVLCPDVHALRAECQGGERLSDKDVHGTVKQLWLAARGVLSPAPRSAKKSWADALLLQRQILGEDGAEGEGGALSVSSSEKELQQLLSEGTLEGRGLYSEDELDVVVAWARDERLPKRRLAAAKVLAACLQRSDTQFTVRRSLVADRVTSKQRGCLDYLLSLALSGELHLHTEIAIDELKKGEEIGEGMAGTVYRGLWKDKRVAIKEFRKDIRYEDFFRELCIMCVVHHEHLVRCLGGVTKQQRRIIVMELMQANLSDLLAEQTIALDHGLRFRFLIDVAQALHYLHAHCNLIHRDLKTLNLLVTTLNEEVVVKVCDFGVSRTVDKKRAMTGNIGTVSWIAPEVFDQRKYNEKADVYSFGIVMWELLTRQVPFANLNSFSIPVAVIKGDRPPIPKKDVPSSYKRVMRECWAPNAKKRPPMAKVLEMLRKGYAHLADKDKALTRLDISAVLAGKREGHTRYGITLTSQRTNPRNTRTMPDQTRTDDDGDQEKEAGDQPLPLTPAEKDRLKRDEEGEDDTEFSVSGESPKSPEERLANATSSTRVEAIAKKEGELPDSSVHSSGLDISSDIIVTPSTPAQPQIAEDDGSDDDKGRDDGDDERSELPSNVEPARTITCAIPPQWAAPIASLELRVNRYFSRLQQDLDLGTVKIGRKRFMLFRAENFAVDLGRLVLSKFPFSQDDALSFTHSIMYEIGALIGRADASKIKAHSKIDLVARINAGLINIAYTVRFQGMAYVHLLPESSFDPKKLDSIVMKTKFERTFETSFVKSLASNPGRSCSMSGGYLSGWVSAVTDREFINAESQCGHGISDFCAFTGAFSTQLEQAVKDSGHTLPAYLKQRLAVPVGKSWLVHSLENHLTTAAPVEWAERAGKNFSQRRFTTPQMTVAEIESRASEELDNFFLDPTSAAVELAEEKCVLVQSDALSSSFYGRLIKLFGNSFETSSAIFTSKFLYDFGSSIGESNHRWFMRKIKLNTNAIERANALPVNMAYLGWCDLRFVQGLDSVELTKHRDEFRIKCETTSSFEADSWREALKKKTVTEAPKTACFMHCGYIAAWLEACFGMPCSVVETHCRAAGYSRCKFTAAHSRNIGKHLPTSLQESQAFKMLEMTYPEILGKPIPSYALRTPDPSPPRAKELSKTASDPDAVARRHSAPAKKAKVERAQSDLDSTPPPKPVAHADALSISTPPPKGATPTTSPQKTHKKMASVNQSPLDKVQKSKRTRSKSDLTQKDDADA